MSSRLSIFAILVLLVCISLVNAETKVFEADPRDPNVRAAAEVCFGFCFTFSLYFLCYFLVGSGLYFRTRRLGWKFKCYFLCNKRSRSSFVDL